MNTDRDLAHAQRFERVFDYIERHLGEALDVEQLSRVAHFSKFHFHRQFTLYAGIGISAYVRMVRLRHASYRLVFRKHERITDIALDVIIVVRRGGGVDLRGSKLSVLNPLRLGGRNSRWRLGLVGVADQRRLIHIVQRVNLIRGHSVWRYGDPSA